MNRGQTNQNHQSTRQNGDLVAPLDRKSTRLNSSHSQISYAVFCLEKKRPICTRLDGIPFALDLGTSRLRMMSLRDLHEDLSDRFSIFIAGCSRREYGLSTPSA